MFNLLPNLDVDAIIKAFTLQTNDMMLVVYVASVVTPPLPPLLAKMDTFSPFNIAATADIAQVRSVLALHALINNKVALREAEAKVQLLNCNPKPLSFSNPLVYARVQAEEEQRKKEEEKKAEAAAGKKKEDEDKKSKK